MSIRLNRREFIQTLGAGLVVTLLESPLTAQVESGVIGRGRGAGVNVPIASRLHIGAEGIITVMTGKVECGQGARATIAQAAAEELGMSADRIRLIMGDTALCPDDGPTWGSQTAPNAIPRVRRGAAAARMALISLAAAKWGVAADGVDVRDGKVVHPDGKTELDFAQLVGADSDAAFKSVNGGGQVMLTAVRQWKVLGTPFMREDRRDLVTGRHQYPSDIARPGMLYGRVLRAPSYGARFTSVDLSVARAMPDIFVMQDGDFVAVAAPTNFAAGAAVAALARSAKWEEPAQISSSELFTHLRDNAQGGPPVNPFAADLAAAPKSLKAQFDVSYIQHAPLEPHAAVAEWQDGKLTVWTGSQNPFGVRSQLQRQFGLSGEQVRVIIPDFGGGFGGKHQGNAALEAARISKAAGKPVWIRWTRQEEFTWAYFRPAGVIVAEAALDVQGKLANWFFININSGPSGVNTPYTVANHCATVPSDPPLAQGSYRGLAISANNFARECFMDELAELAGIDPLSFRLAHLSDPRLIAALKDAATRFDFAAHYSNKRPNIGVGLACGTEKGSFVAACAEVEVDADGKTVAVRRVAQSFDCGAILNPSGLLSQVQGAIVMGIGGALREAVEFENGKITNASFADYQVPRFADLPEMDVHLIDRRDTASAGAGETPIMAIAPAIANAVWHATGKRVRQMPVSLG